MLKSSLLFLHHHLIDTVSGSPGNTASRELKGGHLKKYKIKKSGGFQ